MSERDAFEAWYCAEAAQHGLTFTSDDIAALRDGDFYGDRPALNGKWEGWQGRAAEVDELREKLKSAEAELASTQKALAVVQQSLKDQAAARLDPTMPLLTPEMVEALRSSSEAQHALADDEKDRREAWALELLCDWQDRARARADDKPDDKAA